LGLVLKLLDPDPVLYIIYGSGSRQKGPKYTDPTGSGSTTLLSRRVNVKVELILEQMRLCLATKDFIRTQIISKKISTRFFEDGKNDELKLKFYQ